MTDRALSGHIFLVGFMGAGKTTVGKRLAEMLARPFIDLDAEVERRAGKTCAEIFAEFGEQAFRELESGALADLSGVEPSVVAGGGGIVLRAENRRLLKDLGTVVYLDVTAGEALARIGTVGGRPLLSENPSAATTLLEARSGLYQASADITVDTAGLAPDEVASQIAASFGHAEGTR